MFQGLSNLAALFGNAQALGGKMQQMSEDMKRLRVEGTAGGGMVTVQANGHLEVLNVRIEPSVVSGSDRELLEDLVRAATNMALAKAKQAAAEAGQKALGDLPIPPGMTDMLAKLMGGKS